MANRHQVQLLRSIRETKTAYLFRRVPLKNPEVYIFRAASPDRCTESGSGQQNKVRNFVPTLCEGVAFRYSLLHYPVSGCPPELRPESWCRKSRPLFKMLSPAKANRVRILQQYVITHTSLAEPPCISSGFFSERVGRTAQRAAQGFSEKANLGLGFVYRGYRFGTG